MKLFQTGIVLLILAVCGILVLGLFSGPDSSLSAEITVEAPDAVVFNELLNLKLYPQWNKNIDIGSYYVDSTFCRVTYKLNGRKFHIQENIEVFDAPHLLVFEQRKGPGRAFLGSFRQEISAIPLPDGTTQVVWTLQYTSHSLLAQTYNILFLKNTFREFLTSNLQMFKERIERF